MDSLGYWLFLLILYMLSSMMKKQKQKAVRRQLEQEEETGWKTPEFVKDIFSDFVDRGKKELDDTVFEDLDEDIEKVIFEGTPEEIIPEIPLEDSHLSKSDLSTIDDDIELSTIVHKKEKKEIFQPRFFKNEGDVRMAMIYKEIIDKPRALRRRIR